MQPKFQKATTGSWDENERLLGKKKKYIYIYIYISG